MRTRIFLILCVLLSTIIAQSDNYDFSVEIAEGQTIYFKIGGDGASIDTIVTIVAPSSDVADPWQNFTKPKGSIKIPDVIQYDNSTYKVRRIENRAFWGCDEIDHIILPSTIYSVGDSAFFGCSNLERVEISQSKDLSLHVNFGNAVFAHSGITSFNFEGVGMYGQQMFAGCEKLVKIDGDVYPYKEMFAGCVSLQSFSFPRHSFEIQEGVFNGCSSLQQLNLQDVKPLIIGKGSLDGVPNSLEVIIPCGTIDEYLESEWNMFPNIVENNIPFEIKIEYDTIEGKVEISQQGTECTNENVTIHAIAKKGYEFEKWSDGNTSNPREISPLKSDGLKAIFKISEVIDGIDNIEVIDFDKNIPIYNVLGVPVDSNYKGIVIYKGRKFIVRH